MMGKKQFAALFVCSLVVWTLTQSIISLLPVYATEFGVDAGAAGNFLSLTFISLTAGTMATGWLSNKFQRRKAMLVAAGLVNIPATWLMGQVTAFWQLAVLTAIVWFFIAITMTTINILAGLFAGATERGKIFGLLAINTSLGSLIGGFAGGPIVDRWGYPTLFTVAAIGWAIQPVIALLLEDKKFVARVVRPDQPLSLTPRLGGAFYLMFVATLVAFGAGFVAVLGRPLLMDKMGFDQTAITGAVAIGGAISLPFPILLGWLSDRIGRPALIAACFLVGALGLFALAISVSLWHFWAATVLLTGVGVSLGVGPAFVTDLVPQESLGTALSWYGFAPTIGGILGFAVTGHAIQAFGMTTTFIASAILTLLAVALIAYIQRVRRPALA
jgi:MFS family permease